MEINKTLQALRFMAKSVGLKTMTTSGIKLVTDDKVHVYKQSSLEPSKGSERADWIEDTSRNIIVNPTQIKDYYFDRTFAAKYGDTVRYVDINLYTSTYIRSIDSKLLGDELIKSLEETVEESE
jgi:hypothetical protein